MTVTLRGLALRRAALLSTTVAGVAVAVVEAAAATVVALVTIIATMVAPIPIVAGGPVAAGEAVEMEAEVEMTIQMTGPSTHGRRPGHREVVADHLGAVGQDPQRLRTARALASSLLTSTRASLPLASSNNGRCT